MTDAIIIPFPYQAPCEPAPAGPPVSGIAPELANARLHAAVECLQNALLEQRRALNDWRFAMTELGIGVAGLGHSLAGYQDALGGLDTRLTDFRAVTKRLEAWADAALDATSAK